VETRDFLQMLGRMMRAASRRCAESDEDEFRELLELERVLDAALQEAASGLRASGMSWQQLGEAAGISRQGAQQRWGRDADRHLAPDRGNGRATAAN
jgi:hypothetical protein